MNSQPLISVMIPVYQVEAYLPQCLDSVIHQTYQNLEIILVDDGSTDGSGEICDRYAGRNPRIKVVHQKNQGLAKSRKIGANIATGKYIGFVDSDDWIDPEMFENLFQSLRDSDAQIVTSGYIKEYACSQPVYERGYLPAGVYHPKEDLVFCRHMIFGKGRRMWGISPNFWNKLFEREVLLPYLEQVDDQITYGEDDACVYPCMAFAETVCVTNACYYHYRMRELSMSKAPDEKYFMRINLLYLVMKRGFAQHPMSFVLREELDTYMLQFALRGINGLWGLDTDYQVPQFSCDFEQLDTANATVLYGAGAVGRNCYQQLKMLNLQKNILWIDRNYMQLQKQGLPVLGPQTLLEKTYSCIFVAVQAQELYESIRNALLDMGIEKEKILWIKPRMYL